MHIKGKLYQTYTYGPLYMRHLFLVLGRIGVKEILNMSLSLAVLKPTDG